MRAAVHSARSESLCAGCYSCTISGKIIHPIEPSAKTSQSKSNVDAQENEELMEKLLETLKREKDSLQTEYDKMKQSADRLTLDFESFPKAQKPDDGEARANASLGKIKKEVAYLRSVAAVVKYAENGSLRDLLMSHGDPLVDDGSAGHQSATFEHAVL